jgi:hypothetical protein
MAKSPREQRKAREEASKKKLEAHRLKLEKRMNTLKDKLLLATDEDERQNLIEAEMKWNLKAMRDSHARTTAKITKMRSDSASRKAKRK